MLSADVPFGSKSDINFERRVARSIFSAEKAASSSSLLAEASIVLGLLLLATLIVYASGGTRYAYAHATYVPIIAAAYFFRFPGGVLAGVLAGLALGPFMPLDVDAGTSQSAANWLTRGGFFVLIGGLAGLASGALARQLEIVRWEGYFDPITGLPNRNLCRETLESLIKAASSPSRPILVISIGLGRLDAITSSFGHGQSDALQKAAANRLLNLLPVGTDLFHISSGIFALVLTAAPEEATRLAEELVKGLDEPFIIDSVPILPGGHAGLAQHGLHGTEALTLLRTSVSAFRDAEEVNAVISSYDEKKDLIHSRRLRLLPELQAAIRGSGELTLHYQPKIEMETGICTGAEALVRWHHPGRGLLAPEEFIPLAEQTALIKPLTEEVIKLACAQLSRWNQEGLDDLALAVNVSIRNLEEESFSVSVADLLRDYGINPSRLEIEVTESGLIGAPEAAVESLSALRELGVSVALDDFGAGQSSLTYLRDLPADVLKLDRSFLRDLATNTKSAFIVRATITAGHRLGFKVVAEGIEDKAAYDQLRSLSCDYGQGFFIARPMPEPDFKVWIEDHRIALMGQKLPSASPAGRGE